MPDAEKNALLRTLPSVDELLARPALSSQPRAAASASARG
jgi:hypothetical protein